jgi:hypothetical protein
MPIDHQPAHPPFLEPGFKGTPEGAMKLKMAAIYSDCMADMTRLAAALGQGGKQ